MSRFKTKKLPSQVRESSIIPVKTPISSEEQAGDVKSYFSRKIVISTILLVLSGIFVYQIAGRVFEGNQKYGSDVFDGPKSIIESYIAPKAKGTTNILIVGIGGKGHEGADLTDSIMLASLNGDNNTVTLLSLPRDLYVAYPGGKSAGKINSLYDIGKRNNVGIKYLSDKVSEITGQGVDHYMVIDFSGFKDIVDSLGGISIDVPERLYDNEYPNENWGYMVFQVEKGPQVFDGNTALKYARSRHSTSDFDRSNRQQLIIKAIKEKATDLGIITSPSKIGELYNATMSHLDSDLSIANMASIVLEFSDISSDAINIIALSESCFSLIKCSPGSYLYSPSRDLFGGSAVILPENAQANRLSYYDHIRKFVDLTFHFPTLRISPRDILFISDPSMKKRTQEIGLGLAKLGFPISFDKSLSVSTGTIEKSHINIYWNVAMNVGIDPSSTSVNALKHIEESIPYVTVERNEYINTSGPKIEIIIGKDGNEYFKNLKSVYYIPAPPKTASGNTGAIIENKSTGEIDTQKIKDTPVSSEVQIVPGEWETF